MDDLIWVDFIVSLSIEMTVVITIVNCIGKTITLQSRIHILSHAEHVFKSPHVTLSIPRSERKYSRG